MNRLNRLEKLVNETLTSLDIKNTNDFHQLKSLNDAINRRIVEEESDPFVESNASHELNETTREDTKNNDVE